MKSWEVTVILSLLLVLPSINYGLPMEQKPELNSLIDHYDQRQNGTENYRIQVDGLVLMVAPVESLLLAGIDNSLISNLTLNQEKPGALVEKPRPEAGEIKSKTPNRLNFRLTNLLAPLIRHMRNH